MQEGIEAAALRPLQQHPHQGTGAAAVTVGPANAVPAAVAVPMSPAPYFSNRPMNPTTLATASIQLTSPSFLVPPPQQLPATQGTPEMAEVPIIPGFAAVTPAAAEHQQPQRHTQQRRLMSNTSAREAAEGAKCQFSDGARGTSGERNQNWRYIATY